MSLTVRESTRVVGNFTISIEDLRRKHRKGFHALWRDEWCARWAGRQSSNSREQSKRILDTMLADARPENFWVCHKAIMCRLTSDPPDVESKFVGLVYTDSSPSAQGLNVKFEVMSDRQGAGFGFNALDMFINTYWKFHRTAPFRRTFVRQAGAQRRIGEPGSNTAVILTHLVAKCHDHNGKAMGCLDKIPNATKVHTSASTQTHTYMIRAPLPTTADETFVYRLWRHQRYVVTIHRPRGTGQVPDESDPGLEWGEYQRLLARTMRR